LAGGVWYLRNTYDVEAGHLTGRTGAWGGVAHDNRRFVNAVLWIFRTGSPWRDLPADYGDWSNTHWRFCRWRDKGIWEKLLEIVMDEPDFEWLVIDATHCKVHQQAHAEHLIADKGYDSDEIVRTAQTQNMQAQIPPRKNRKHRRQYDKHLYRQRHLVENAFAHIKQWRSIATRYAKNVTSSAVAWSLRS